VTFERLLVASDYQGLKEHIAAVSKRQETEDRRYRSSLYLGTPGPSHLLRFTGAGMLFSSSSADSLMRGRLTQDTITEGARSDLAQYTA